MLTVDRLAAGTDRGLDRDVASTRIDPGGYGPGRCSPRCSEHRAAGHPSG